MSDVLSFANVSVVRGQSKLLDDVNWEVEEGERWVVVGPNGAGKSTLMGVASAHIHPTSGTVHILDETLGEVDVFELRPRIGLSSSGIAGIIPAAEKVSDVVVTASYGMVGRWREQYDEFDYARARELLGELGIADLADRRFGTLSEGERKRVLIARSLMTDPELLLLDEPAAGLDLGSREELIDRLGKLAHDLMAPGIVLVTHHVEEIPAGFTDILMLRDGKVTAAGPLETTLTAENLSATFGLELELDKHGDRYSARAKR